MHGNLITHKIRRYLTMMAEVGQPKAANVFEAWFGDLFDELFVPF